MSVIIVENVAHAYGDLEVLRGVNVRIADGDHIGLVGPNGEGKTTLLRIVAGLLESTGGEVHRRRGLRIGYLPQDPPALEGSTVRDAMLDVFADLRRMEQALHDLADRMGEDPERVKQYGAMQHEFEALGGYEYSTRIDQVLTGLGFGRDLWGRPLRKLSGGQRTRAYLAMLLLQDPDVLLLDEPTNHLDLASIEWLERWLESFPGALVVVSHDRYLLDRVTTRTWEIAFCQLDTYRGAYSKYLTLRRARHNERLRQWEAQQEYIKKTQEFIRIHIAGQRTAEAKGRRKRLERFLEQEAIERPRVHRTIGLELRGARRSGDIVMRATRLEAGYDPAVPVLKADGLELVHGQRVAVAGPNGAGKTTLLRTLLGELDALAGELHHGANVRVGYLSQTHGELDPAQTALDAVREASGERTSKRARSVLGRLLFTGDDVFKRTRELSGGQRSRVALARLAVMKPNLLVLDEPTNHLDIASTEAVQAALQQFDGTILFVTHDRYLIQALATHVWAIEDGVVSCITGNWERYVEWRAEHRGQIARDAAGRTKADRRERYRQDRKRANEQRRLRQQLKKLEDRIESLEQALARINEAIGSAAGSGQVDLIRQLGIEHQQKSAKLQALWTEWEQLGEQIQD